ncbi:MAG: T9SS type A sorting domain-containing protein, partial [Bacteroidia bacterium]
VLCNGALTGAIDIEVAGGTESYSYNWSNSAATEDLSGAGAGTYTCTVTDSRGCTAIISSTITQPAALALNATVNQIQCNGGTGSVLLNVTGGVTPYTVNWSNGNSTQSNTGLLSGTYTVTVTDVNGCTKSGTFTINTEPTVLSISCSSTNNNCFNSNNGTVSASASGGTTPYTYNWSNGSTSASQSNLPKGTYIVTFTDAHGCTASCLSTITQPAALAVTTVAVNPTSGSPASGTINVNVTGGTPAYSYQWNNGSTQQNRTGLSAGTYTVTVTDANGCSATKKVALTYTCQLGYVNTVVTKPSCGKANGVATVTGTGGTGYTYAWQTTPVQTTATGTGLLYYYNSYCLITDVTTGCSFMDTVTLPTSNGLLLTLTSPTYAGGKNIRCYGETNGSISLIVSGSTGPYTYLWNTGGTTQNLTGLGAGTYIVTVSNGGCTSSNLITLTQPAALLVATSGTNPSCGGSNGTATASASGGVAPYSYSWNTVPVKTGATATGLTAGVYTVTVSDANGCTKTAVVTLTTSGGLTITGIVTDAKCNGSSTGSIDITPSGGTAPYTYLWSTGATTQDRKNVLAAGTYTVTVTDKKGCAGQYSAIINEPTAITATSSSTNVSCYGGSNGSASVTPTGGTPGYTYSWNTTPAKTGSGVTGLKAGTFIAIITDSKSCMKAVSVTITQPSSIVISISKTNVTAFGGSNGTATANVSGGVSPYGYSWNTVPVKSTQTATGLSAGTYTVTVTDANGCTKTKSVTITQPTARLADNTNSNNAINSVVYPNPTTGKFSVSFDETIRTDVNLQVFSMTGERVFMSDISVNENASSFDMDLSRLTKGIYFIRYRTNDKDWMEKLVIQ